MTNVANWQKRLKLQSASVWFELVVFTERFAFDIAIHILKVL